MKLVAIIAALFAERFLVLLDQYRQFTWLNNVSKMLAQKSSQFPVLDGALGVLLIVLLPAFLVQYVYGELSELFVLLGFAFAIVILIAGMGPKRFYETIKAAIDARNESNADNLHFQAEKLLGKTVEETDINSLSQLIIRELFVIAHERIFAVIFWFVILGPLGVVMFRIANELSKQEVIVRDDKKSGFSQTVEKLEFILAWIPARLLAFSYAIMGNFSDGMSVLKNAAGSDGAALLADVGVKSINLLEQDESCLERTFGIMRRSIVLWVGVIAVLTISNWVG